MRSLRKKCGKNKDRQIIEELFTEELHLIKEMQCKHIYKENEYLVPKQISYKISKTQYFNPFKNDKGIVLLDCRLQKFSLDFHEQHSNIMLSKNQLLMFLYAKHINKIFT